MSGARIARRWLYISGVAVLCAWVIVPIYLIWFRWWRWRF